jgi:hypothetical protein
MADTIIVRSTSGVLFEFDVPTTALAKERLDQQIAKGDLSIVPRESVEWVTRPDGSMVLVDRAPAETPPPVTPPSPNSAPAADKAALAARAAELGIEVKGNWGAAKIATAIEAAEKAAAEQAASTPPPAGDGAPATDTTGTPPDDGQWSGNTPVIES